MVILNDDAMSRSIDGLECHNQRNVVETAIGGSRVKIEQSHY